MAYPGRRTLKNLRLLANKSKHLAVVFVFVFSAGLLISLIPAITGFGPTPKAIAITCDRNYKLLGIIPTWYEYMGSYGPVTSNNKFVPGDTCGVVNGSVYDYPAQIGLAMIDILLRIGALVAVVFIIMGGYRYMSSQGEPKNIEVAMATLVNAAIGLAIVLTATVIVSFVGAKLG